MSTLTLLDEIDDFERLLAGAPAQKFASTRPGPVLAVADDEDDEDDLFGEDDLGFDDIDEEEDADEDEADDNDDIEEDIDDDV